MRLTSRWLKKFIGRPGIEQLDRDSLDPFETHLFQAIASQNHPNMDYISLKCELMNLLNLPEYVMCNFIRYNSVGDVYIFKNSIHSPYCRPNPEDNVASKISFPLRWHNYDGEQDGEVVCSLKSTVEKVEVCPDPVADSDSYPPVDALRVGSASLVDDRPYWEKQAEYFPELSHISDAILTSLKAGSAHGRRILAHPGVANLAMSTPFVLSVSDRYVMGYANGIRINDLLLWPIGHRSPIGRRWGKKRGEARYYAIGNYNGDVLCVRVDSENRIDDPIFISSGSEGEIRPFAQDSIVACHMALSSSSDHN